MRKEKKKKHCTHEEGIHVCGRTHGKDNLREYQRPNLEYAAVVLSSHLRQDIDGTSSRRWALRRYFEKKKK